MWEDFGPEIIDVPIEVTAQEAMNAVDYGGSTSDVAGAVYAVGGGNFDEAEGAWGWEPAPGAGGEGTDYNAIVNRVLGAVHGIASAAERVTAALGLGTQAPPNAQRPFLTRPIAQVGALTLTPLLVAVVGGGGYLAYRAVK